MVCHVSFNVATHVHVSTLIKKLLVNFSKSIDMSFFSWKGSSRSENAEHTGRNLQDGLFQIASQACHILVQVRSLS